MKIQLNNIGVFKYAEYELGNITIICGENNTGKTYATYSLFAFYDFWENGYFIKVAEEDISKLMNTGTLSIKIDTSADNINKILEQACKEYSKFLSRIFAAQEKFFENSTFKITLDEDEISIANTFNRSLGTAKNEMIQISKESGKNEIFVSLLVNTIDIDNPSTRSNITTAIGQALKEIIFGNIFSNVFIASAERTGAVIFRNELNFEKNILLNEVAGNSDIDIGSILNKIVYNSKYPLPVKTNIDFIRKLEDIVKEESIIAKKYPQLLNDFSDIIGGEYKVGKDGLYYQPKSSKVFKFTMGESSSSIRSLLDIGFYLRYIAQIGDLLVIDEPELNLHPNNQRKLARLLASLANIGIKVFITTHSDYIIKELNTLIMLNFKKESSKIKLIMTKYKYNSYELIKPSKIKVFISEKEKIKLEGNSKKTLCQTLKPANIDEFYGIEARSFDKTIVQMNDIQESIILG